MIGNLKEISAPSKIRDHLQWLSTSITSFETRGEFDTDASWWHTLREDKVYSNIWYPRPSQRHIGQKQDVQICCLCMFGIGCVGAFQITTWSPEYPNTTRPSSRRMHPVCHLIRLIQKAWKLLSMTRYGMNHEEKCTVTNTLIVALTLQLSLPNVKIRWTQMSGVLWHNLIINWMI